MNRWRNKEWRENKEGESHPVCCRKLIEIQEKRSRVNGKKGKRVEQREEARAEKKGRKTLKSKSKCSDGLHKCGILPKKTSRNACRMADEMAVQIFLSYRIFKFTSYQQWSHRLLYIYITHTHKLYKFNTLYVWVMRWCIKIYPKNRFSCVHNLVTNIALPRLDLYIFYTILFVLLYHHRITKATTFEIRVVSWV